MNIKIKNRYCLICCLFLLQLFYRPSYAQEPIWVKMVSGPNSEYGFDSDLDSQGNMFIIGQGGEDSLIIDDTSYMTNGRNDAFIAKLSPDKDLLWLRTLGGADRTYHDNGLDVHVDINDDVILLVKGVGGNFTFNGDTLEGVESAGQYSGEGVMIKVDNHGIYQWHDHGSVSSSFQNVTTDSSRNIYMTGWFSDSITLGDSIQLKNLTNGTTRDMFVAKYSPDGQIIWAKNVGGRIHNAFAFGHNIAIDHASGKIVVIGRFSKTIYFDKGNLATSKSSSTFMVAYDENGIESWKRHLFQAGHSYCQGLAISTNGIIGVVGYNSLGYAPSGLVGFYNLKGAKLSQEVYESTYCRLHSIDFNALDECFITGLFQESVDLGPGSDTITLNAPVSGFILKLNRVQKPRWAILIPATFENKVTCKDDRVLYAAGMNGTFIYNYGNDTINNAHGDALFAEIEDLPCPEFSGVDTQNACNSYKWINGKTYRTSVDSVTHVIAGGATNGCDSIVTLDLTIFQSATGVDNRIECNSFNWIDGNTYTSSNDSAEYKIIGGAANGCDSLVKLNLIIVDMDTSITQNDPILTANESEASYQWINCATMRPIGGATNQSFTPDTSGIYAVELRKNGCTDTSACMEVIGVGIHEINAREPNLDFYPNPTTNVLHLKGDFQFNQFQIRDVNGKLVLKGSFNRTIDMNALPAGLYLINLLGEQGELIESKKFVKQK